MQVAMHWRGKIVAAVTAANASFKVKEAAAVQAEDQLLQAEALVSEYNSAGKFVEAASAARAAGTWQKKALAAHLDMQATESLLAEAQADAAAAAQAVEQVPDSSCLW